MMPLKSLKSYVLTKVSSQLKKTKWLQKEPLVILKNDIVIERNCMVAKSHVNLLTQNPLWKITINNTYKVNHTVTEENCVNTAIKSYWIYKFYLKWVYSFIRRGYLNATKTLHRSMVSKFWSSLQKRANLWG